MAKRILLVDDMASVRLLLKNYLSKENFAVDEAENGVQALMNISASPPDIVILDVLMPKMDGIECCRRIKTDETTKHILVIMVTSIGDYEQERQAFSAGCDSYLTKPIRKERLLGKINLLLTLRARSDDH